jgi:hypothetical protein
LHHDGFVLTVLIGHDQFVLLPARATLDRDERYLGREDALYARQLLVNHVGGAVGDATHRAARRRNAVPDELPPAEYVEQLETDVVLVVTGLFHTPDHDRLGLDERPVVEVQFAPVGRFLQHVLLGDRFETAAALQIGGDEVRHVERHARTLPRPSERHDGDRRARNASLGDFHRDVGDRATSVEGGSYDRNKNFPGHVTGLPLKCAPIVQV